MLEDGAGRGVAVARARRPPRATRAFASVLVIDASRSMRGERDRRRDGRRPRVRRPPQAGAAPRRDRCSTSAPSPRCRSPPTRARSTPRCSSAPRLEAGTAIHEAALAGVDDAAQGADRRRLGRAALRRRGHIEDTPACTTSSRRPAEPACASSASASQSRAYRPGTLKALAAATGGEYALGVLAGGRSPASSTGSARRSAASTCSATAPSPARTTRVALEVRVRGEEPATSTYTSPALALEPSPGLQALGLGCALALAGGRRPRGHAGRTAHRRDRARAAPAPRQRPARAPEPLRPEVRPRRARCAGRRAARRGPTPVRRRRLGPFKEDLDIARIDVDAGALALLGVSRRRSHRLAARRAVGRGRRGGAGPGGRRSRCGCS